MVIKDMQGGLYEIKVDTARKIVYQTHFSGIFDKESLERLDRDYKTKVIPLLKNKKWAKLVDLRNYKVRDIVEQMNQHNKYCIDNGMSHVALIVESVIVKMQMNRAGKNVEVSPTAFTDEKEARDWLSQKGY
ncbi:TPA: hypothetical protein N2D99_002058 [Clostridium botulinum]|nr:hypothetical protein [Clostridium botulinum]